MHLLPLALTARATKRHRRQKARTCGGASPSSLACRQLKQSTERFQFHYLELGKRICSEVRAVLRARWHRFPRRRTLCCLSRNGGRLGISNVLPKSATAAL
ncbi:unnamed protein product [Ixodes pacificus]